ncbi:hypothetical protein PanWU01x14_265410 [Parasponia andersonii]|uniref:Transmembrane protein n=1 Tax=Parasponia andersonii TaxID=3476 RepID=A0A2P5B7C8_PARAD|nr:hypothetical protein PanWU01x14_265410 [Parasponia andersonii]
MTQAKRGDPLTSPVGGNPHIRCMGATLYTSHAAGTLCAGCMGIALLSWLCRFRPTSVSRMGAVLYGGRTGTSRARGRMGFVPCVAVWYHGVVVFPTDLVLSHSSIAIDISMPLTSDYSC